MVRIGTVPMCFSDGLGEVEVTVDLRQIRYALFSNTIHGVRLMF